MNRVRVKIWDPPVGFRIKKNGICLRSEFDSGSFLGLARFQIANEYNLSARITFTLVLSDYNATTHAPGAPIVLQPGESRSLPPARSVAGRSDMNFYLSLSLYKCKCNLQSFENFPPSAGRC